MTIGKTILISALCGALFGLLRIHGAPLLIAPAICGFMIYRRGVARRAGKG